MSSADNFEFIQALEKGRNDIYQRPRVCLIPKCNKPAIRNSHVLQRKRILEKLADASNKFYVLDRTSLFNKEHSGLLIPQKKGLKASYVFPGFCEKCDRDFFSEIEIQKIDFRKRRVKSLFAYRTLCLELRKTEISLEHTKHILDTRKKFFPGILDYIDTRPKELAISDLQFFKKELEEELSSNKKKFKHYHIRLPQRKLCFSSPLNIHDPNNPKTFEYDEYGYTKKEPIVATFLNYFPYENHSYLFASFHTKLPCHWTLNLLKRMKNDLQRADKEISDIVTYRVEFWAISPSLYESWSKEKVIQFLNEMDSHTYDFSYKIESNFNIWI